jgi:hypothetical protein
VDPRLIKNLVRCWLLRNATLGMGRGSATNWSACGREAASTASGIGLMTDVHWDSEILAAARIDTITISY